MARATREEPKNPNLRGVLEHNRVILGGGLETGEKHIRHQIRILLLIALVFLLLILPVCTHAQDKDSAYQKRAGPKPTGRVIDNWIWEHTHTLFCFNCHSMLYPVPPEMLPPPQPVTGLVTSEMEPGLRRLTDSPGRDVEAIYSPEGDRIVWVTDSIGNWTIWSMNDDGSDKKQLTSEDVISGWPSWSPNGQEIAYWSYDPSSGNCDIWKMKADGSSKVRLTTDGGLKEPPDWSPRGDRIAYNANQTGNMEVYAMNADGNAKKQLTKGHTTIGFGSYIQGRVRWHPDGERLYFEEATFPIPAGTYPVIPGDVATVAIHVVNVDTGEEKDLTPHCHDYPKSFSPDGKKLAIISFRTPNYGLWIMNADGSNQTRLTWDDQGDRDPRFCPDGKKIVYWSFAANQPDIWMINADGTNKAQLTKSPYQDVYPSWSPDGKKIVFESDRAGSFDIWQISMDRRIDLDVKFESCMSGGGTGKAFVTVKPSKNESDKLRLEKIGLNLQWDREGLYVENLSSLPKTISGPDDKYQSSIGFAVPTNMTMGYYFYNVKVQYTEISGDIAGSSRVYEQTAGDLQVGTPEHSQCDRLYIQLATELNQVNVAGEEEFRTTGKYPQYVLEANKEFYTARILYRDENFAAALPQLQSVRAILNEQSPSAFTGQDASPLITLTSVMVFAAILAALVVRTKRKGALL